jgi:hypothetical protein
MRAVSEWDPCIFKILNHFIDLSNSPRLTFEPRQALELTHHNGAAFAAYRTRASTH